jgi:hypothetical protein
MRISFRSAENFGEKMVNINNTGLGIYQLISVFEKFVKLFKLT